jgi:TolB-like protein/lipopolysaccharide biosynthesis regulator YciM
MSSIIEGYNYDIFISYRQKDNKGDRWVSEFVEALKTELESTFKEEISVYFDINPHDGLLETHDVDESLKEKLKCLVFIPIISRTYCDPKSFAWEHEFKAFVEQASKDPFGLKVKLLNGNVASRVLPIRIYDLDNHDFKLFESILGGVLRGVEFIYSEPGVNRPLKPDDDEKINLNRTKYRNQINKVGNAIKEIISGLKKEPIESVSERKEFISVDDKLLIKEKSIIVLPFENISPNPEQDYFSDGLTEEIITDLSHIHDLLVISRSSAMTFKGTKKTIPEIAQAVNVRYVLEGSVRKAGNNLRIAAQLIDAITDTHLWTDKYNGTIDDVFDIQEKVSKAIVNGLKLQLTTEETKKLIERPITNLKAYECYLQARQEIYRFTENGLERGLQLIKNGLEIIGENELLYSIMGTAYYFYVDAGIKPGDIYLQKAEECVHKIFRLNPESPHGYYLSGSIHFYRKNNQQAVKDLRKGLAKDPNNPDSLIQIIRIYSSCGKNDKAMLFLEKALAIDPLNAIIYSLPGYLHLLSGHFDTAVESYYKMYQMDPESPIFRWFYALALIYARRNQEAFRIIDQLSADFPGTTFESYGLFIKNALQGKKKEALEIITPELEAAAKIVEYHSREMAHGYAILGEVDKALYWLEKTINCGFINYPFMSEIDPFLENIRGEERFKKLMERVKYEWENFEV